MARGGFVCLCRFGSSVCDEMGGGEGCDNGWKGVVSWRMHMYMDPGVCSAPVWWSCPCCGTVPGMGSDSKLLLADKVGLFHGSRVCHWCTVTR